jgi:hypothetical protein
MSETTTYELTGIALAIVEQLAKDENITSAEALTLIIDQAGDPISRGLLLGGQSGKEMLGSLLQGQHPVKTSRVVLTGDVAEATRLINEARSARGETSDALIGLIGDDYSSVSWKLTLPNGDTLHLTLTRD